MSKIFSRSLFILAAMMVLATPAAYGGNLGPTGYLSFADSPFFTGSFSYFYLENFEGGALNTPGVTASAGSVLVPSYYTDSVDADDGLIDGSGQSGYSWYSNGNRSFTFTFSETVLGKLPTHAGLVWTDVGFTDTLYCLGNVSFEGFDQNNSSLGSIGPFTLGDGSPTGGTAEDRFFGVIHLDGISKITISMPASWDWEVDHLQYGGAAPLPASFLLFGTGLVGLAARRLRKLS